MQHSKFGFGKTVDLRYEEAVEKVRVALQKEGYKKLKRVVAQL